MIKHLACVMDGNRRWAKKFNMATLLGHKKGADVITTAIKFCFAHKIKNLSLWAFSIENFKREEEEKNDLFAFMAQRATDSIPEFIENNVRVRFIGEESLFPALVRPAIALIEAQTAHLTGLNLNFLFCYAGRQDILRGVKKIAQSVYDGTLKPEEISDRMFYSNLWLGDLPEPELILFSGRMERLKRLSNFLLFQAAYSEIYFADCLWPDLTEAHLEDALDNFARQQRNLGR